MVKPLLMLNCTSEVYTCMISAVSFNTFKLRSKVAQASLSLTSMRVRGCLTMPKSLITCNGVKSPSFAGLYIRWTMPGANLKAS